MSEDDPTPKPRRSAMESVLARLLVGGGVLLIVLIAVAILIDRA